MTIDIKKKYRTRNGREVRIYATDKGFGVASVHGAIKTKEGIWYVYSWSEDGLSGYGYERDEDLIEVKPRIKQRVWINVYPDQCLGAYHEKRQADDQAMKRQADDQAMPHRIGCVQVEIDCEEGEGL